MSFGFRNRIHWRRDWVTAWDPFDIATSAGFTQLLRVYVCPEEEVTVFSHMPARILSSACSVVAVVRAK